MSDHQQELVWEDLPTIEELDRAHRENMYHAWCRAFSVWLTDAIKQNIPPSEFKTYYGSFVPAILCMIEGILPGDHGSRQRLFNKLCTDLHKTQCSSNGVAIFDSYFKEATQHRARFSNNALSRIAVLPTTIGSVLHFCDPGVLIKSFCFYVPPEDDDDEWSLSLDHPDATHWYLNAGFIEVADALQPEGAKVKQ